MIERALLGAATSQTDCYHLTNILFCYTNFVRFTLATTVADAETHTRKGRYSMLKIRQRKQANRLNAGFPCKAFYIRPNGGIPPPPPPPGGIIPPRPRIIFAIPPFLLNFFIIFCICLCCLSRRLTSCICVPEPAAIRRLRELLITSG